MALLRIDHPQRTIVAPIRRIGTSDPIELDNGHPGEKLLVVNQCPFESPANPQFITY